MYKKSIFLQFLITIAYSMDLSHLACDIKEGVKCGLVTAFITSSPALIMNGPSSDSLNLLATSVSITALTTGLACTSESLSPMEPQETHNTIKNIGYLTGFVIGSAVSYNTYTKS